MFFSCLTDNNFELSDELRLYLDEIGKIYIYSMDRSKYFLQQDYENMPLYTEKYIRQNGHIFIFMNHNSRNQVSIIAILLCTAKKIDLRDEKNTVQTFWKDGVLWTRDSGCVIDIYDTGGNIIKTYIMKNGLDVFYEKSDENTFYEMPRILLDKFYISKKEFLRSVKK